MQSEADLLVSQSKNGEVLENKSMLNKMLLSRILVKLTLRQKIEKDDTKAKEVKLCDEVDLYFKDFDKKIFLSNVGFKTLVLGGVALFQVVLGFFLSYMGFVSSLSAFTSFFLLMLLILFNAFFFGMTMAGVLFSSNANLERAKKFAEIMKGASNYLPFLLMKNLGYDFTKSPSEQMSEIKMILNMLSEYSEQ